jgi:predicted amidohydrolase
MSPAKSAQEPVAVAAAQFAPAHGDVPANLRTIGDMLAQAVAHDARLVVFPELATTGYAWTSPAAIDAHAEPVPGPTTDWLTGKCVEGGCYAVLGMAERDGRRLYNTAVLVGPDGLIGRYRKTKLWSWDTLWATGGDCPSPVWETAIGRIGALICADTSYPEGTAWLARAGADLIALPTCWSKEPTPSPLWRTRAHDSGIPFAVANVSGTEWGVTFAGGSCVVGETGELLDFVPGTAVPGTPPYDQAYGSAPEHDGLAVAVVDVAAGRRLRRERAARRLSPASPAFEALDRNVQRFPAAEIPGRARPPAAPETDGAPLEVMVVQGPADGDADKALDELLRQLSPAVSPAVPSAMSPALAVLPTLTVPDLARDPGLLPRFAACCGDRSPADVLVSVLDEATGDTLVLLAAGGAVVTSFRVNPAGERTGDGAEFRPLARPWGSAGLLTAAELLRPEPARCLAVNGADLIAASGRLPDPPVEASRDDAPSFNLWRVRAGENNCYIAVANAVLPDGRGGRSVLYCPDYYDHGAYRVTLPSDGEHVGALRMILDPATPVGRMVTDKPLLGQRRPELYVDADADDAVQSAPPLAVERYGSEPPGYPVTPG